MNLTLRFELSAYHPHPFVQYHFPNLRIPHAGFSLSRWYGSGSERARGLGLVDPEDYR